MKINPDSKDKLKVLRRNLALIERLEEDNYEFVFGILKRYCSHHKSRFYDNNYSRFELLANNDVKFFDGDGVWSVYRLVIPWAYFEDFEAACIAQEEKDRLAAQEKADALALRRKKYREKKEVDQRKLFEELKKKFEP